LQLRSNTQLCINFVEKYKQPVQPPTGPPTSFDDRDWVLGDLPKLVAITKDFVERIAQVNQLTVTQSRGATDLKALVYKGVCSVASKRPL
jgi:hypothetical protein